MTKIGYPDQWRDYGALKISRDDLFGNVMRANEFEYRRNIDKLGKPVDRGEWRMTPQTVNAYYNPTDAMRSCSRRPSCSRRSSMRRPTMR